MLDYAFRFVEDSVIFLVGTGNVRSRKAMQKIGGILTERRVRRSLHGKSFDFVVFEIRRKPGLTTARCESLDYSCSAGGQGFD